TEMLNKALEVTKECMELLENYVRSPADQQILLDVLEDYCELNPAFVDSLQKILTVGAGGGSVLSLFTRDWDPGGLLQ
ncbi:hypothetical protein SARC_16429, partial [Sphaeroforma arctica JP610]